MQAMVKKIYWAGAVKLGMFITVSSNAAAAGETEVKNMTPTMTDPMSAGYLMQLTAGLLIVVLCIVVLGWLAKRVNRFASSTDGSIKILGGLAMGTRERVVMIQVESTRLLLGVSPGRIQTLHVLPAIDVEDSMHEVPEFDESLIAAIQAEKAQ